MEWMISQIFVTAMIKCPNQSGLRVFQTKSRGYICYQNIVCSSQSKLSQRRKCPLVLVKFPLFLSILFCFRDCQWIINRIRLWGQILEEIRENNSLFAANLVQPMSHRESVTLTYFVSSLMRPRCITSVPEVRMWLQSWMWNCPAQRGQIEFYDIKP